MTKMQITADDSGRVTLSYDGDDGERVTRAFTCPIDGGYVREYKAGGDLKQVCDKLYSHGSTLMASNRSSLADLIRREYKAMRAKRAP